MDIGSIHNYGKAKPYTELNQSQNQQVEKQAPLQERVEKKREIEQELAGINKWLKTTSSHVKFTLHEELNEYYVQIINDQTNEVIREVPSKKMMDIAAKMHEMIGLLVDEKR
ncbi:flagellar biosynthesis protein FlaG [Brevibacillus parabrevis]|uniref:flagellar protein FlaG n=1 Tax=Brevibacillus parabrevis TaxID=54914 RepID=UPI0007ABA085|nr:flagellar protein FlaG [Brevibacillus parabrevis]KZE48555.1 flagellar biosynthesis protein FlaG [Brevibacillus parabrevis]